MQSTWKCISMLLLIFFSAWVCTHHNNVGEITQNSRIVQLRATALDLGLFSVARFAREVTIKETFMEEFLCNFRVLQKQDFSVCTYAMCKFLLHSWVERRFGHLVLYIYRRECVTFFSCFTDVWRQIWLRIYWWGNDTRSRKRSMKHCQIS